MNTATKRSLFRALTTLFVLATLAVVGFIVRYTVFFQFDDWVWQLHNAECERLVARAGPIGTANELDAHIELEAEVTHRADALSPEQLEELANSLTLAGQLDLAEDMDVFHCRHYLEHPELLLAHARAGSARSGALARGILAANFWRLRTIEENYAEQCRHQMGTERAKQTPEQREILDNVWRRYGASALVSLDRLRTRMNPARRAAMQFRVAQALADGHPSDQTGAGVENTLRNNDAYDELKHFCDLRHGAGPIVRFAMRCDGDSHVEQYVDLDQGVVLSGERQVAARSTYLQEEFGRLAGALMQRVVNGELPQPNEATSLFEPVADETGCEIGYETVDGFFDAVELTFDCGDFRSSRELNASSAADSGN